MSTWIVDIHGEIEGDYELICKAESTIPLDKVKQAREEIASSLNGLDEWDYTEKVAKFYIERDLRILDELIESEG